MSGRQSLRDRMVRTQIEDRGVRDPLVLAAMRRVRRELFIQQSRRIGAYLDRPISIGAGQTISQPYIVAYMIEALALRGGEKVLEVGAGSGYAAAVSSEIADQVFAIERIERLAESAKSNLAAAGYRNVYVRHADGTEGWPEHAPFDAILVSAGAPDVPKTLMHQLAVGGRMVVPVGTDTWSQELIRLTRIGADEFKREGLTAVSFVPLIGKEGWRRQDDAEGPATEPPV
jgi:protein-L-isoaspartate(D-aspartate) O-methyltransferase